MEKTEFAFLGYKISKINFVLKDEFYLKQTTSFAQELHIQRKLSKEKSNFFEIVLDIKIKNEEETVIIGLEIKGGFETHPDIVGEHFDNLSFINAPAILYPFARSIITSLTAQAGIPPINLPIVNFMKAIKSATQPTLVSEGKTEVH